MSFLEKMYESLGKTDAVIVEKQSEPEPEDKPVPKKQEQVFVQIMDCDMQDSFYGIGHEDFCNFLNKFVADEYGYTVGGVFGSEKKPMNEGKPDWFKVFGEAAKPIKKVKTKFYIDQTDPMDTIKEVTNLMRVSYPDLIVGF